MTRPAQWVIDRRPPRKQTPPYEFLTEPCRTCFALTHPADVGPAVVHLDTRTYTHGVEGWRWNPPTKSWELTYVTTEPNGFPIYALHQCRPITPQGDAAA